MNPKEFFFVGPARSILRCETPGKACPHRHHLFLASAVREATEGMARRYHLDKEREIALCLDDLCGEATHFASRQEAVAGHRERFDFPGEYRPLVNPYSSLLEGELLAEVERLGYPVLRNTRKVIYPYEVDIFLPTLDVALEFNGAYWHSEERIWDRYRTTPHLYHLEKQARCGEQGVTLGFVWEQSWRHDWLTVMDMVSELVQFRCVSPLLSSLGGPPEPMDLALDGLARRGMEKHRERLTKKAVKQAEEARRPRRQRRLAQGEA